ncbi:hypothetical protein JCM19239_1991 [Vibrio variabilis]|uniref:Uncharacterized protein n=1 Tax=Vibrio variabilis TaxID=990271 RepID=A0ABQ0J6Y9_9VIBR|nr:hypothetical protein JCM19239_1991 [Vibrio variabilis]
MVVMVFCLFVLAARQLFILVCHLRFGNLPWACAVGRFLPAQE